MNYRKRSRKMLKVKVPGDWTTKDVETEIAKYRKKGYRNVYLKRHGQLYIQAEK